MNDTKERSVRERVTTHPFDILDSHAKALLSKDRLLPKFSPGARAMLRAKWCDVLHDLVHGAAASAARHHPESPAIAPIDVTRALKAEACAFGGYHLLLGRESDGGVGRAATELIASAFEPQGAC